MITITIRFLEGRIVVEDGRRTFVRSGVNHDAMLRLLRNLVQGGRYARIHSNDQAQVYTFTPVVVCRVVAGAQ